MSRLPRRRMLVASAVAALGTLGTLAAGALAAHKVTIALVMKSLDDPFVIAMVEGAKN
jgi:ribose transport system substrate-binding protein